MWLTPEVAFYFQAILEKKKKKERKKSLNMGVFPVFEDYWFNFLAVAKLKKRLQPSIYSTTAALCTTV